MILFFLLKNLFYFIDIFELVNILEFFFKGRFLMCMILFIIGEVELIMKLFDDDFLDLLIMFVE